MNTALLDDISIRFITLIPPEDRKYQERIFFLLEEAYWFFIDFYRNINKISLKTFCEKLLKHNQLKYKEDDYMKFQKYKKQVPVYGALILNTSFEKILLVKGFHHDQFFFPKGKKNRDERPVDCATREVFEEIGYNVDEKIIDNPIRISEKFCIFPVYNVKENIQFVTRTRNEIREIRWISINEIENEERSDLKQIKTVLNTFHNYIQEVKRSRFMFDRTKFNEIFDSVEL